MPLDEITARRQRLADIRKQGIDPYPSSARRTHEVREVLEEFENLLEKKAKIIICGRAMTIRRHGGATFITVRDNGYNLQVYCKRDIVGSADYKLIGEYDLGDFLEIAGTLFVTHKGESTLLADGPLRLLAKALRPLPEKWHGLSDVETRYRKRYLDLLMNSETRIIQLARSNIIKALRDYLDSQGFIEVETPILQSIPGGASARPFITHLNALDIDLYLRVAPELYLKRLLIGGFTKIYEVARCFRNEGIDHAHNPEFTQIELYQAYVDYSYLMNLVEELMSALIMKISGKLELTYDGQLINFKRPYAVMEWLPTLEKAMGETIGPLSDDKLRILFIENGIEIEEFDSRGTMLDKAYKKFVRPFIVQPTFLINHPVCLSPLAKRSGNNSDSAERFQLVVGGGVELVNGFSELNDPIDQRSRLEEQERLRQAGDEEAQRIDDDFLEALEYGMPPAAGLGMGIDRLAALLTGNHSLKEVIMFPTMRPKEKGGE